MIDQNFLIVLVGLPASGKTTFAILLKETIEQITSYKVKIIDPDKIRNIHFPNKFNSKNEHFVRKTNLERVESALKNNFIVISDDLNYYTSMRHDLKEIAENLKKSFFFIYIATPFEVCVKWNEKRGHTIPNQVISNVNVKFDSFHNYNWDEPLKSYDLSKMENLKIEITNLVKILNTKLKLARISDTPMRNEVQIIDRYHKVLDKQTRLIVGELLKNPELQIYKNRILKLRKLFIKKSLNLSLKDSKISKEYITFLEKNLNLEISY